MSGVLNVSSWIRKRSLHQLSYAINVIHPTSLNLEQTAVHLASTLGNPHIKCTDQLASAFENKAKIVDNYGCESILL